MAYYTEEGNLYAEGEDPSVDGFMQGYVQEEDVQECDECGSALYEKIIKTSIEEKPYKFCSEECRSDFKETL